MAREPKEQQQETETADRPGVALEQVAAENVKLKAELEALRGVVKGLEAQLQLTGMTDDIRDEVMERVRMGLPRHQAIEVVRRQRAHDAELKAAAESKPAK